jgi:peptidyl-prolyl cis-trans isomerase SurA
MISSLRHFTFLVLIFPSILFAQEKIVIDKIVAVVGGNAVLQSDIENQYIQMLAQRQKTDKCEVFENFLIQKLMVNQAKVDSIEVNDITVESQLDNRMKYFIDQAGSKEKLEAYFNRSIFQIKEDMRITLKEQMIMQKMQGEITGSTKITPTEVEEFYNNLPKDSIPSVNSMVEYMQICRYPPYAEQSKFEVKKRLLELRKRILDGEKFATLAYLYSEDPGTARNGGEVGFLSKGEMDPEYAKVCFNMKENSISNIVESSFGYHVIQMIGRREDKVNTRHILMRPKATEKEIKSALLTLDSIAELIKKDTIKFDVAAIYFSEDKNSRLSGGKVINPSTNSTKFELDQLSQEDYYIIKKMKAREISQPFLSKDENKRDIYKIVKLLTRSNPHKANLKEDYQLIQDLAIEAKKKKVLDKWVIDKQKATYFRIDDDYRNCKFKNPGWLTKAAN